MNKKLFAIGQRLIKESGYDPREGEGLKELGDRIEELITFSGSVLLRFLTGFFLPGFISAAIGVWLFFQKGLIPALVFPVILLIPGILFGIFLGFKLVFLKIVSGIRGAILYALDVILFLYEKRVSGDLPAGSTLLKIVMFAIILPEMEEALKRKFGIFKFFYYWPGELFLRKMTDLLGVELEKKEKDREQSSPENGLKLRIQDMEEARKDTEHLGIQAIKKGNAVFNRFFLLSGGMALLPVWIFFSITF